MSFSDVLTRGDEEIVSTRPQRSWLWNTASLATSMAMIGLSKVVLFTLYKKEVQGIENFDKAKTKCEQENRGLVTIMNHMSTCDDPMIFGCLPWKYSLRWNDIRWGLAAANVCFVNKLATEFFSLGKIIPCERFGRGPFQSGLDACVRILSPDDTLDTEHVQFSQDSQLLSPVYTPPMLRSGPSWVHVFPEGYVCQLRPPFQNSMRFFRWGTARLVLEPTVAPVIVPIFATGFELVKPEELDLKNDYLTPNNVGATIKVNIGEAIDDKIIGAFREEWQKICTKYPNLTNPGDLSFEAKFGAEARELRARVCSYLREQCSNLRRGVGLPDEDPRFASVDYWKEYTSTRGKSDPEVEFVGINWAIKEYQRDVSLYDDYGNVVGSRPSERPPGL